MPVRDDLLQPISEEEPAGANLAYDKVFDQIREARTEEDPNIPRGNWSRPLKKADWPLALRLAGEALATRSKDLRLAGWYGEALLRQEGIPPLSEVLVFLHTLQDQFWDGLYPLHDEDGDLGLRAGALEAAVGQLAAQLRQAPITRNGLRYHQVQETRLLSVEAQATTPEKKEARADALKTGKPLPEDLEKALAETPKQFYAEADRALRQAALALERLDDFGTEHYGNEPPSLQRLKTALEEVSRFTAGILAQKREAEPDPPAEAESPVEISDVPPAVPLEAVVSQTSTIAQVAAHGTQPAPPAPAPAAQQGMQGVVKHFLDGRSLPEAAYLIAAAPGVARVFAAGPDHAWHPPAAGNRQRLRQMARLQQWAALQRAAITALAEDEGTVWLDLHRYVWLAAEAMEHQPLAIAVLATMQTLLRQLPSLDKVLLEDDTPIATMETQLWLESLREGADGTEVLLPALRSSLRPAAVPVPDPFADALALVRQGRTGEAIALLTRDAESQPSGRLRFERRLQAAELCVEAKLPAVAQPLLADLMAELEKRTLDGWESGRMLGKPLALLIRCIDLGASTSESRDTLFGRLCRLDPVAATGLAANAGTK